MPAGDRRGRVHSSTVTVAVLEAEREPTRETTHPDSDFQVSFFSGTGPGGQNRNKVQASARILHRPTGLVRTAQTRSRENSVRLARAALEADLARHRHQELAAQAQGVRAGQVGSGQRGDKRRTYRFQDDRVSDHATGRTGRVRTVMGGDFSGLWPAEPD